MGNAGQFRLDYQQNPIRPIQHGQRHIIQSRTGINNHITVKLSQLLDKGFNMSNFYWLRHFGPERSRQHLQAALMSGNHTGNQLGIQFITPLNQVHNSGLGFQIQNDINIPKLQAAVYQNSWKLFAGQCHRQIHRQGRTANPPFRAVDSDHFPFIHMFWRQLESGRPINCRPPLSNNGRRRHLQPALVSVVDSRQQFIQRERLRQEISGPGHHRPPDIICLTLDRHHDHLRFRKLTGNTLAGGYAIHIRHINIHQDYIWI